jgi:hypothetical protein
MAARPRPAGGVKHGKRCACPTCDPGQRLLAAARAEARARRALPRPVPLPLAADRPRRMLPVFETQKTKRFRELLASGVGAVRAMQILDADLESAP